MKLVLLLFNFKVTGSQISYCLKFKIFVGYLKSKKGCDLSVKKFGWNFVIIWNYYYKFQADLLID